MRLSAFLLVASLVPQLCLAGASLGTDQLEPLIGQMPAVQDALRASVHLSKSAFAEVRLGPRFTKLRGSRTGPYTIEARSKKDGSALVVVLCTRVRFVNGQGKELPAERIEEARSIEEMLTGVMLRQGDAAGTERPAC